MRKFYIKTDVNVKNGIFQFTSASRRAVFETSIQQMVAPFCIFCKCAGYRLTPGGRHAPGYPTIVPGFPYSLYFFH